MSNDKTEQPIPGEMLNYWQSKSYDALCRFDEKPIAENMLFEKGYIEGRKDQYLHSLQRSPKFAEFLDKMISVADADIPETDSLSGCEYYTGSSGLLRSIKEEYIRETAAPSPLGEAGPRWVKASKRQPQKGKYAVKYWKGKYGGADYFGNNHWVEKGSGTISSDELEWLDESPNPSRAGEISPVLPRWVKNSERFPTIQQSYAVRRHKSTSLAVHFFYGDTQLWSSDCDEWLEDAIEHNKRDKGVLPYNAGIYEAFLAAKVKFQELFGNNKTTIE